MLANGQTIRILFMTTESLSDPIADVPSQELHPMLRRAGVPVQSSKPFIGRVPGAHLGPEATAQLREELRAINVAETVQFMGRTLLFIQLRRFSF